MKTFKLQKGDHVVSTISPAEAVTYRARGYVDYVKPEPKPAPKPKPAKAETAEAPETKN